MPHQYLQVILKSLALLLTIIILLQQTNAQNLIRNPNFTGYSYTSTNQLGEPFGLPSSNYSLWYNDDSNPFKIVNKTQPVVGEFVELIHNLPYYLCQRIDLEDGQAYEIGFLAANPQGLLRAVIGVYVNGLGVFNQTVEGEKSFVYGVGSFTSIFSINTVLCFYCSQYTPNNIYPNCGPTITNISLSKTNNTVSNTTAVNNTNNIPTNTSTNTTAVNNTGNTSTNTSTNTTSSIANTTNNSATNTTSNFSNTITNNSNTTTYAVNNQKTNGIMSTVGIIIKSVTFKFFRYLTIFIDDIEYYKYHRYEYPQLCQQLMDKFDIFGELAMKILIDPSNPLSRLINLNLMAPKNIQYLKNNSPHPKNPQSIYFLNSIQSFYMFDLPLAIFCYAVPKLVFHLLKVIMNKAGSGRQTGNYDKKLRRLNRNGKVVGQTLVQVYRFLGRNFRWWGLIVLGIQNNIARLTFYSGLQMTNLYQFQFRDKANIVACLFVFLLVIMYCLVFYQLVYKYQNRRAAKTILIHSAYKYRGCYLQSYCFLTRLMIRALVHSTLLQNYQFQIVGLAFTDLLTIMLMLSMRRKFYSTYYFIAYFGYNLLFLVFDLLFCIAKANLKIFLGLNFETMMLFWLWIIVVAYILSILVCTGRNIWQIILGIKKKILMNIPKQKLDNQSQIFKQDQNNKFTPKLKTCNLRLSQQKAKKPKNKIRKQKVAKQIMICVQKNVEVQNNIMKNTKKYKPKNQARRNNSQNKRNTN